MSGEFGSTLREIIPAHAATLGALEVIGAEHPAMHSMLLDVARAIVKDASSAAMVAEVAAGAGASLQAAAVSGGTKGVAAAAVAPVLGTLFCALPDVSCLTPRGKHDIEFYTGGLVLRPKSAAAAAAVIEVRRQDVAGVFYLQTKEQHYVVYALCRPIAIGKTLHSVLAVCETVEALRKATAAALKRDAVAPAFSVPVQSRAVAMGFKEPASYQSVLVETGGVSGSSTISCDSVITALRSLSSAVYGRIGETDAALFKSAGGNTFVRVYLGVNDGLLFPLRRAFVFIGKPLLVLAHSCIARTEVGRAGGGASTFDLSIAMTPKPSASSPDAPADKKKPEVYEFSMIPKDELDPLRAYVSTRTYGQVDAAPAAAAACGGSTASSSALDASEGGSVAAGPTAPFAKSSEQGVAVSAVALAPAANMNELESVESGDDDDDSASGGGSDDGAGSSDGSDGDEAYSGGSSDSGNDSDDSGGSSVDGAGAAAAGTRPKKAASSSTDDADDDDGSSSGDDEREVALSDDELGGLLADAGADAAPAADAPRGGARSRRAAATGAAAASSSAAASILGKRDRAAFEGVAAGPGDVVLYG